MSLRDVIGAMASHLARHAERGERRLKRLVLEMYHEHEAPYTCEIVTQGDDVLAPLRVIADGPVEYREIEGVMI